MAENILGIYYLAGKQNIMEVTIVKDKLPSFFIYQK